MRKRVLSRRAMLRGMLGGVAAAVALPPLEAMLNGHGTAYADGTPFPVRFMTWINGNGVRLDRWTPATQGVNYELTPALAPLANVKDYCSVLSGFLNKAAQIGPCGHHNGASGLYSGFSPLPFGDAELSTKFGGPSIDQVAASHIAGDTFLPSVQVAASKFVVTTEGPTLTTISHKSPDEPIVPLSAPKDVFAKLFGGFTVPDDPENALRVSMLDAVMGDATRLKSRVGLADQKRLDAHLDSIRTLEKQIEAIGPKCVIPAEPDNYKPHADGYDPIDERAFALADLIAYAFACDITRVASYVTCPPKGAAVYAMTGSTMALHQLTHTAGLEDIVHATVVVNMTCFAHLLEKLKSLPEGDGNLLDNCCILLGSDVAEGLIHTEYDIPIVVAGRGGGALRYPGEHYRSPNADDPESTSKILLSCLQAVAPEITEVGGDAGHTTKPCAALAPL